MRHLLLALLIALLPVLGWVGNAMAVDMAAQQVVAVSEQAAMPADCPMQAEGADQDGTASQQGMTGAHCADCDTCQLCLALALFTWDDSPAASYLPPSSLLDRGSRFSSVDAISRLKPPIS